MKSGNEPNSNLEAIEILQDALKIDETNHLTLFNLANCHYELQEFDTAVSYYEAIDS